MCLICLASILSVDSLFAAAGAEHSRTLTNFEILNNVATEAAKDIIAGVGVEQQGETVLLYKAKGAGSVDFVLEDAFLKEAHGAGVKIAVETPNLAAGGKYRLAYQTIHLSLSYPHSSKKWLVGSRTIDRLARADIFAQLIEVPTGNVVWIRESHKQYNDRIDYSDLASVEDAQYDFTKPPHSEFRMTRLLEPLIVGGIVVGLVYLFFSNQSNNK